MRKRLQIAFMLTASTAIATSFSSLTAPACGRPKATTPSAAITTTDEHGRKIYVNDDLCRSRSMRPGSPAQALDAGVLEQQGKSVEAGAFGGYGLDAGGAVGGGGGQPVFRARIAAVRQRQDRRSQRQRTSGFARKRLTRRS